MTDTARPDSRRKSERIDTRISATLAIDGEQLPVQTRNVSIGGVFIETTLDLGFETRVELHLQLQGIDETLIARGRVRWVEKGPAGPTGVGIQFDGMSPKDVWALNKFVADCKR